MFYDLTRREFFRELVIAQEHRNDVHDRDVSLAWAIAAMTRGTKGLPKLETLLSRKPNKRQSAQEQVAMWQYIAARFGGEFKPVKRESRGE